MYNKSCSNHIHLLFVISIAVVSLERKKSFQHCFRDVRSIIIFMENIRPVLSLRGCHGYIDLKKTNSFSTFNFFLHIPLNSGGGIRENKIVYMLI